MKIAELMIVMTGTGSSTSTGSSIAGLIVPLLVFFAFMYLFMIKPQQKEQKAKEEMRSSLEVGDTVLTSSGFYGVIIDITEDTVIVEFGSNKNCRIPMQKEAIVENEKPGGLAEKQ